MRRFAVPAAVFAVALCAATPAAAQMGVLSLGAAYGSSRLVSGRSDDYRAGWHAEGLIDLSLPLLPIDLRAEGAYDHLDNRPGSSATFPLKVTSAVLNATVALPFPLIRPYAIGGIGFYSRNGAFGGGREGKVGINGGAGAEVRLPVIRVFAEARYHSIPFTGSSAHMLPITVGVIF